VDLTFFNPYAEIEHSRNRLPHWQQNGAVYFVTFRLADALPAEILRTLEDERKQWLKWHPEPWTKETEWEYQRRFSGSIEQISDRGYGECLMRDQMAARIVGNALAHFERERCHQLAWVVMPNHVHAAFIPRPPWTLAKVIRSWKSFTSHAINELVGKKGPIWQRDYFDRLVRNEEHFANVVKYIRNNPIKACIGPGEFLHWESGLAQAIE